MTEKNKYGELDALATITVNRILEQVVGDPRKIKINETENFNTLKNKWTPQVKELYLTIFQDFENVHRHTLTHLRHNFSPSL